MRVGRHFVLSVPADSRTLPANWAEQSRAILAAAGFKEIAVSPNQISATRGRFWQAALRRDPRSLSHAIYITKSGVTYVFTSPTPMTFSSADEDVLNAEAMSFLARLSGTCADDDQLRLALARQRTTDTKILITIFLFALLLGFILPFT
jgi:hypothetical protein